MAEKKLADWEKIWHSGLDYVAPGHEVGSHPAEQGNVTWSRTVPNPKEDRYVSRGGVMVLNPPQFDIVHTSDYKQEPLPGQWLVFE